MKHTLYFILVFGLLSCQSQDNSTPAAPDNTATDTIAVAQPSTPAPDTPDSAYLIVPGESIGRIRLGMPAEEVTSILGEPDSSEAAMGKALMYWVSRHHYVATYTISDFGGKDERPKVQQIQVTSPQFQTIDSISTGKSLPEIRQQYKDLKPLAHYRNKQQQQVYIFDEQQQGIAFEVTLPDSLCTAITVHPKGQDMTDTYLPLHPDMTRVNPL